MDDEYGWLEDLHRLHYDQLLRLARNRLKQSAATTSDAEDIVQQAFLLAAEKDISSHEAPLWWLMRTVDNLCRRSGIRAHRDVQRQLQMSGVDRLLCEADLQGSATDEREMMLLVRQTLKPDEWALLQHYSLSGRTANDLAQLHGMDPNALRVRVYRLRKKLRAAYYGQ